MNYWLRHSSFVEEEHPISQSLSRSEETVRDSVETAPCPQKSALALNGDFGLFPLNNEERENAFKEVHGLPASNCPHVDWFAAWPSFVESRQRYASAEVLLERIHEVFAGVADPHVNSVVEVAISSASDVRDGDLSFAIDDARPVGHWQFLHKKKGTANGI